MIQESIPVEDEDIIRSVQAYCADVEEFKEGEWTEEDGKNIAVILNTSRDPWGLFRFIDERTGDWRVGYRTRDGREWFHILRQMRNTVGSGLLENLPGPMSGFNADGSPSGGGK